ncbi:MAG: enoyl-CoA hydratase-related protein [Mesorhizobium sp.]|nr:enoyl-CoA hydratase-related protein [Mesorhizobium sp.]
MAIQDAGRKWISVDRKQDGVATIRLDRPEKKNAIDYAMWRALAETVGDLSSDEGLRALVLGSNGPDFCAGADISEFDTMRGDPDSARIYEAANSAAFAALRNAAFPTIAAIRGVCYGGGFGLAAACDLRIAAADARFAVPAARLGLAYPVDAMGDIVHAVGPQMARYLTYTGASIGAAEALDAGFLLEMVETEPLERASQLASTIATNAPLSIRASKASIAAVLSGRSEDAETAARIGDATFTSADYAEGRAAFRDKRKPVFRGT